MMLKGLGWAMMGVMVLAAGPVGAQSVIVPDETLGGERSVVIPLDAAGLSIDAITGGAQRGQNLFHSFREFNVSTDRGAYFFPDAAIKNILTRVTGGNISTILGTLGAVGDGRPNLFLINPHGIVFGPKASLDVQGSFAATTAGGMGFGTAGEFSATNPQLPGELLTINPLVFIFTALQPQGAIVNQSRASQTVLGNSTLGLRVPNGQTLLLVGGDIVIDGGQLITVDGRIEIGAVAGNATVGLTAEGHLGFPADAQRTDVLMSHGQISGLSFMGSGDISITARNINILRDSLIGASTPSIPGLPPSQVGSVKLNATGVTQIQSSQILSAVLKGDSGNAGDLEIVAGSLELKDGSGLSTSNLGTGGTGNISINARDGVVFDQSQASAIKGGSTDLPTSRVGSINLTARSLSLAHGSELATFLLGQGKAGDINVNVQEDVDIFGTNLVDGVRTGSGIVSAVFSEAIGTGGNINLHAKSLAIQEGGGLFSSTLGQGNSGNIFLQVQGAVSLDQSVIGSSVLPGGIGKAGDIDIQAQSLTLVHGGQLSAGLFNGDSQVAGGRGSGGNIRIKATDFVNLFGFNPTLTFGENLTTGTAITQAQGASSGFVVAAEPGTVGAAGSITVETGTLRIADGAIITASTANASNAGDITINAANLEVTGGGQLLTTTFSGGQAGNIKLNIADQIVLSGSDAKFADRLNQFGTGVVANQGAASGILANTALGSTGNGGSILIDPKLIIIKDGARVAVESRGSGAGGNIQIQTNDLKLDNRGFISAGTASGQGGDIGLQVKDFLLLRQGSQITATAGTSGNGGNININSRFIIAIPKENSDITANAFTGSGGRVSITSQGIFGLQFRPQLTPFSDITASSDFGFSGTVILNTPDNSGLQNGLNQLPTTVIDTNALLASSCIVRSHKRNDSFYVTGSSGLPLRPGDAPIAPYPTGELQNAVVSSQFAGVSTATRPPGKRWQKGDPIVEPTGVYQLPDGQLILSRECTSP